MSADPSPAGALTPEQQAYLSDMMRQFQVANAARPVPRTPQEQVNDAFQALAEHQEPDSPYASQAYIGKVRDALEKLASLLGVRSDGATTGTG